MKKFYILLHFILLIFTACDSNKDNDIVEELSKDCKINSLAFSKDAKGVKIQQGSSKTTIAIARNCPSSIDLTVKIPKGAKISSYSKGISLKGDNILTILLQKSEQHFVITSEDKSTNNKYNIAIISDKLDEALYLIEQTFLKDSTYKWVHTRNEKEFITSSKKVNVDNPLNTLAYSHTTDSDGTIISTTFTDVFHKKYTYKWMYNEGRLTGYTKSIFNLPPEYYYIECNKENQILNIIEKNKFNYIIGKKQYEYNDNGLISKCSSIGVADIFTYEYDAKKRIIKDGKYSYEYDEKGNRIKETNLETSKITTSKYSNDGRILESTNSDVISTYEYFDNKRRKTQTHKDKYYNRIYTYKEDGSYAYQSTPTNERSFIFKRYETYDTNQKLIEEKVEGFRNSERVSGNHIKIERNSKGLIQTHTNENFNKRATIKKAEYKNKYTNDICTETIHTINGKYDCKAIHSYNNEGLHIKTVSKREDNTIKSVLTNSYCEYGKIKASITKNETNTITKNYSYTNNFILSKRHIIIINNNSRFKTSEEIRTYHSNGNLAQKTKITYDSNEVIIRREVDKFNKNGRYISTTVYDKNGNVI